MKNCYLTSINTTGHIDWLDSMKALLIISMVIGHSTCPVVTYIYLFHMPAFFILSGYTYRGEKYKLGSYIKKKLFTMLIPTLLINIIYISFYGILQISNLYHVISIEVPISFKERIINLFLNLQTPDFGGATWFLFVLLEAEILIKIFQIISEKLHIRKVFWIIIFAIGLGGYFMITKNIILPYYFDLTLMACLYFALGLLLKKINLFSCIDHKVMLPFCIITTFFFGSFYFNGQLPMNWPTRTFSNLFIQVISCLAATYLVWITAIRLNNLYIGKYLRWLGKHTYCVLVTHFAVFRILFGIGLVLGILPPSQLQQLTPNSMTANNGGWLFISILTIIICSIIAWIAEKNKISNYLLNARYNSHKKGGH